MEDCILWKWQEQSPSPWRRWGRGSRPLWLRYGASPQPLPPLGGRARARGPLPFFPFLQPSGELPRGSGNPQPPEFLSESTSIVQIVFWPSETCWCRHGTHFVSFVFGGSFLLSCSPLTSCLNTRSVWTWSRGFVNRIPECLQQGRISSTPSWKLNWPTFRPRPCPNCS